MTVKAGGKGSGAAKRLQSGSIMASTVISEIDKRHLGMQSSKKNAKTSAGRGAGGSIDLQTGLSLSKVKNMHG